GSFFMLEVYDGVIPSHRLPTLIGLFLIAAVLYRFQGPTDVRSPLLRRGTVLSAELGPRLFPIVAQRSAMKKSYHAARLALGQSALTTPKSLRLNPDMPGKTYILSASRADQSYLIRLHVDQVSKAFREK